ncbi:hypothetical protein C922_05008 [Plasmodium inui San Antonio 1]|uniref:Uncharacterized protein n=1 Tax=Plasmodium inui San Antonio 1 TaxID=1237626 RepID=W6ZZ80_9APIC|nr:hypothetical protein C922_05008 [Plasmodium inui San Antonio 1]EUD64593.1 hypothetical protein C922_05008 [Plasmodium inui San Antonio 1]
MVMQRFLFESVAQKLSTFLHDDRINSNPFHESPRAVGSPGENLKTKQREEEWVSLSTDVKGD